MEATGSKTRPGRHVIDGEYTHKGVVFYRNQAKDTIEALYDYNYKPDDIILATYPKCGTTWMQEIIYGIVNCKNLQESEEQPVHIMKRFPFLEMTMEPFCGVKILENMPSPRLIKTHLRKYFFVQPLKQKNKIVVVMRNVKDAIVSFYYHYQSSDGLNFDGHDFDEFFDLFREKHLVYGDWYDWVLDWWTEKDNPNVCFVFYEDMKENIRKETRRVAQFLGHNLTDDQIQFVADRANFDTMKKKRMVISKNETEGKGHFRKGIVGDWRSHFSVEQTQYVDQLTTEKLEGTGLQFKES